MKLFKKRWHRLPIGILTVILLTCLVAGSAFAAVLTQAQTITQTIDPAPDYGVITADNFVTLDNVVASEEFSDTTNTVVVELGPDGVGKYLHLKLLEASADLYDEYSVTLNTGPFNKPAGSNPVTLTVRKALAPSPTILEASVQLTVAGTYTFAESILGTAGSSEGTANVRVTITLEDDPVTP